MSSLAGCTDGRLARRLNAARRHEPGRSGPERTALLRRPSDVFAGRFLLVPPGARTAPRGPLTLAAWTVPTRHWLLSRRLELERGICCLPRDGRVVRGSGVRSSHARRRWSRRGASGKLRARRRASASLRSRGRPGERRLARRVSARACSADFLREACASDVGALSDRRKRGDSPLSSRARWLRKDDRSPRPSAWIRAMGAFNLGFIPAFEAKSSRDAADRGRERPWFRARFQLI